MRTLTKISALLSLLFAAACSTAPEITGTYVSSAKSAYSIAADTMVITLESDNRYIITHYTGITLLKKHRKLPHRKLTTQTLLADYDPASLTLTERKRGRVIHFGQNQLQLENSTYTKLH